MLSFERTSPATIANFTAPFAGLDNYRFVLNDPTSRSAIVPHVRVHDRISRLPVHHRLFARLAVQPPVPGEDVRALAHHRPLASASDRDRGHLQVPVPGRRRGREPAAQDPRPDPPPDPVAERPAPGVLDDPRSPTSGSGYPFFTLLLYSALQDVPVEVREAAIIDGAGPWQRLRLVIVPIILPVIEVTLLLGFVFTVKVFDLVIGLTGGGPGQRHAADHDLVLQPVVPGVLLRRGRGTQQRAARAGADRRTGVPVAQPGLAAAQLGGRHDDPRAEVEGPALALHARGDRCPRRHPVPGLRDHRRLVRVDRDAVQRHVLLAAARGDAGQLPNRLGGGSANPGDGDRVAIGQRC